MTVDTFIAWDRALGLRRSAVLFITLWMTWRTFAWAATFADRFVGGDPAQTAAAAALLAAVMAPVTYLQKAVFSAYIESKEGAP